MLTSDAGIAQLVEHNLAMVRVASSNLVSRSNQKKSIPKSQNSKNCPFVTIDRS